MLFLLQTLKSAILSYQVTDLIAAAMSDGDDILRQFWVEACHRSVEVAKRVG